MKNFILSFILLILNVNLIFSQSVDVTFMVDMQYQTVSNDGVHIAGSMQGWDPPLRHCLMQMEIMCGK